jgi:hypothetical protein
VIGGLIGTANQEAATGRLFYLLRGGGVFKKEFWIFSTNDGVPVADRVPRGPVR